MYLRVNFDDRKMSAERREWGVGAFWEWFLNYVLPKKILPKYHLNICNHNNNILFGQHKISSSAISTGNNVCPKGIMKVVIIGRIRIKKMIP
jgi:hypothetical protein